MDMEQPLALASLGDANKSTIATPRNPLMASSVAASLALPDAASGGDAVLRPIKVEALEWDARLLGCPRNVLIIGVGGIRELFPGILVAP